MTRIALISLPILGVGMPCFAAENPSAAKIATEISTRLKRVEEFNFIRQEAAKLGVRAWLFGGTAAGYAHYVKWDLLRENGDTRFQSDRFDYDYTNIYRSTQDLDIVIDGNAEQAEALQNTLAQKYPHLQGSKTAWEVRLLTQSMGDKQAILNNPDFINQHTDSNSTGLIEITSPRAGESVVRDVRDWNSKEPYFLKDVQEGALHYYFSPLHQTTTFAKEGRNPPILSAIRYLTKAFQYELKLRPEDLAQIKKVIDEFDPDRETRNSYVASWIEKNGKKLIQNAVNIEYATNILDQLGLRKKLIAIQAHSNRDASDSLAWWMNKEPLRTQTVGLGSGKTAQELGLDVVAHETNHFLSYESITRSHTGDPNVLISRNGAAGETAVYGNGFYTRAGREGAAGTGLTIRFRLLPGAREGTDFVRVAQNDYVLIMNKAAVRVIPESVNIGPVEYFELLGNENLGLDASAKGILEKLKRRISAKTKALSKEESDKTAEIVMKTIRSKEGPIDRSQKLLKSRLRPVVSEWFKTNGSRVHPEIVDTLMDAFTRKPHWYQLNAKAEKKILAQLIAEEVLSQPAFEDRPELVEKLLQTGLADKEIIEHVLSKPHWQNHPEWVEHFLKQGIWDVELAQHVFSQPHWEHRTDWVDTILSRRLEDWIQRPEWVQNIVKRMEIQRFFDVDDLFVTNRRWVEENAPKYYFDPVKQRVASFILTKPYSQDHPEWLESVLQGYLAPFPLEQIFSQPHWRDHPRLRELTGGEIPTAANIRSAMSKGKEIQPTTEASCVSEYLIKVLARLTILQR